MIKSRKFILSLVGLFLIASVLSFYYFSYFRKPIINPKIPLVGKDPIQEQIDKMTPEQKIGQLIFVGNPEEVSENNWQDWSGGVMITSSLLTNLGINSGNSKILKDYINNLKEKIATGSGIVPFVGVDQEGGPVCRLSWLDCTGQKDIKDESQAYELANTRGKELAGLGINTVFAPLLDVSQNQNDFVWNRTFAQDETGVAVFGQAMINGFTQAKIIACTKHFPGHGGTITDSHYQLPVIECDEECLKEKILPFKKVIDEGVKMIMVGHLSINNQQLTISNVPASLSKTIITDILRKQLGFQGIVITDDLLMRSLSQVPLLQEKVIDKSQDFWWVAPATVEAVKAGVDMVMVVGQPQIQEQTFKLLLKAVENGEISQERIEESLRRILKVKQLLSQN